MKNIILSICLALTNVLSVAAQELNAKVTVRATRIQGVDQKLFETLENALNQLVNNTKWTEDNYKPHERIECAFLLNVNARNGNTYSGTLTITASRPVYNTTYMSPLVNHIDKDVSFKYEQGQLVEFDIARVRGADPSAANLPAIIAYYVYVILGMHYDSFSQGGGTEYYKKAQQIVINAPDEAGINGWKSSEVSMKNRFYLIDQFLNPRFASFRPYLYVYHRYGMDQMAEKTVEGSRAILDGINSLETLNKENPSSILLQFFFTAKGPEYINILRGIPEADRKKYAARLASIDIPNAARYNDIK
ncbi:MAG TPA: DUF4835 family protein [Edaphocola sp.]|nr:DUF4835 family protein [Edaphocola sp.]